MWRMACIQTLDIFTWIFRLASVNWVTTHRMKINLFRLNVLFVVVDGGNVGRAGYANNFSHM